MRLPSWMAALVLTLGFTFLGGKAQAASTKLGLGADYWFDHEGVFELLLRIETNVTRHVALGGRVGGFIATGYPNRLGIPADLVVQGKFGHGYIEGVVGPWVLFNGDPAIRAHVGMGFGIRGGPAMIGLEIGWLDPSAMAGLRVAFTL